MKPTNEQICAWMDGEMSEAERIAFEREAGASLESLRQEQRQIGSLGSLLRSTPRPALENADFFNNQILREIEAEQAAIRREAAARVPAGRRLPAWFFPISLSAAAALALLAFSKFGAEPQEESGNTEVLAATVDLQNVSAVAFELPDSDIAVIWIDGLDYLPANHPIN